MLLLLVEDDELAARAIEWALDDLGVDVRVATSGRDVLRLVEEIVPDAVVLDVILEDVDGVTLCGQIRARWPRLPIVLASGRDADFPGVQEAIADRRTTFLQKPFDIETLLATIETLSR